MQFTKLFNSILDSTIWQEPKETKILWITMLAMADRNGEVHASVPGLASRAGISLSECEDALECLQSPDKYSRTKDHDGRRIESMDGGWRLLNHGKYRALLSVEERREYNRRKQAEYREARRKSVNDMSMTVIDNAQCQHSTEAEAEEKKKKALSRHCSPKARGSREELQDYAQEIGLPRSDGEAMHDHWEANGWRNGANPVRDWKAGIRKWKSQGWLPSQKNTPLQKPRGISCNELSI